MADSPGFRGSDDGVTGQWNGGHWSGPRRSDRHPSAPSAGRRRDLFTLGSRRPTVPRAAGAGPTNQPTVVVASFAVGAVALALILALLPADPPARDFAAEPPMPTIPLPTLPAVTSSPPSPVPVSVDGGDGTAVGMRPSKPSPPPRPQTARPTHPSLPPTPKPAPIPPRPGELQPLPPSREADLKSTADGTETAVEFVNARGQQVAIYWLDYGGNRQKYADLPAYASYRQHTYVTHPWVVTDPSGRALMVFLPAAEPQRAVIR